MNAITACEIRRLAASLTEKECGPDLWAALNEYVAHLPTHTRSLVRPLTRTRASTLFEWVLNLHGEAHREKHAIVTLQLLSIWLGRAEDESAFGYRSPR